MAPKYKLTYFPLTALGEPIRWILSYGDIEFEDVRFTFDEWEEKFKPNMPFGKVPVLEIDGKVLHQCAAICRYLAKQQNLAGKTDEDALQADIIVDTIVDFRTVLADYYWDENKATKETKLEPLQKNTVPYYLSRLDKIVKENNGHFVKDQLTWADFYYAASADYMQHMSNGMDFASEYPNLAALKAKVEAIPQVKAWIAKRPNDP